MKRNQKTLLIALCLLAAFVLWTAAVCFVDVQTLGPQGSTVGFGTVNGFVHSLTGAHFGLYHITDWLGLVPVGVCMGFALAGLVQWIKRKDLRKVDFDILALGVFYIVTIVAYLFFEKVVINYRPVLIDGVLEASYPSSTTLLTLCVMLTAVAQCKWRIKGRLHRRTVSACIALFTVFMVLGRLISGVHWFTDIVGAALFSGGLVMLYTVVCKQG